MAGWPQLPRRLVRPLLVRPLRRPRQVPRARPSVPRGGTTAGNGAADAPSAAVSSAAASSAALLSLVGPVIVKRLAPVVGAAATVALLTWGIRRVIRRRTSAGHL